MTEKGYLLLLKEQVQSQRVVFGFNQNVSGDAVVTTGIPRQYNEDKRTYVNQKTMSYDDYIMSQFQESAKRRR